MSVDFIAQPQATFRIGDFLKESFADPQWSEFRAAVAFVKRSGTKHIRQPLRSSASAADWSRFPQALMQEAHQPRA